jgi:uncharacterized protein YndB with AHSA1/START domain
MIPAPEPRRGTHELFISRTFAAPVALVYRLWSEPAHMQRWWGPKDFICRALEMDFRPGGRWRACIESSRQLVTVTFTEQGALTLQTFHQAPFLHVEGRDSHVLGWNSAFDCEAEYALQLAGAHA